MIDLYATCRAIQDYRSDLADHHGVEGQCAFVYEGACHDIIAGKYPVTDPMGEEMARWAEKRGLLIR
jgi:hypothetical protein